MIYGCEWDLLVFTATAASLSLWDSISGLTYINSEDPVFDEPIAIAMLIDIFTERGFTAVVDIRRMEVPERVDPDTHEIVNRIKKVYRVRINFPGSKIRRGV